MVSKQGVFFLSSVQRKLVATEGVKGVAIHNGEVICNSACQNSCSTGGGDCSGCCAVVNPTPAPTFQPGNSSPPAPTTDPKVTAAVNALVAAQTAQGEAQQALTEAISSGDPAAIAQANVQLTAAIQKVEAAANNYNNALEVQEQSQQAAITAVAATGKEQNSHNTTAEGNDPVMITTGVFTTEETDLSFTYGKFKISVVRKYLGNNTTALSFGPGWVFNYDTRIIRRVKPGAGEETVYLQELYSITYNSWQEQLNAYNALYSGKYNTLLLALTKAQQAVGAADEYLTAAVNAVNKALAANKTNLLSDAVAYKQDAEARRNSALNLCVQIQKGVG